MRMTNTPFFLIVAAGLLIMPSDALSQAQEATSDLPQVAQPLVREGDFAIKLVEALKMGKAEDEAQAESLLVAAGIEPRNGWISDYPVTPDVIGQLQESITASAGSGKLAMTEDEALQEFQTLCASLGLSIVAGTSGPGEGNEPETDLSQYDVPTVVNSLLLRVWTAGSHLLCTAAGLLLPLFLGSLSLLVRRLLFWRILLPQPLQENRNRERQAQGRDEPRVRQKESYDCEDRPCNKVCRRQFCWKPRNLGAKGSHVY